jgi:hypothetical protein
MDDRTERKNEIRTEQSEIYEPPVLEEIGGFSELTRAHSTGSVVEGTGYYPK